ncbi:OsmC family protein [Gemmatimonadota bacterium]
MDLITVTREEGVKFSIRIRDHVITTDMSVAEGGSDGGPAPVELLGAAAGACLATMVQSYCDSRGFTDGDVGVSLTLELEPNPNRISGLVLDVDLPRDVPEGDKEKLKKMALQMPVPATLRSGPRLDIEML